MIQPCHNGDVEDRNPLTDGLCRVVKKSGEVGISRQAKAGNSLLSTIDDEECSIGQSYEVVSDQYRV